MQLIPQTASMYELKNHTRDVVAKFKAGPVLLMNRSTPQAVLVSPEEWNRTAKRLTDLEFELQALRARFDTDPQNWFTMEEVEEELHKRGLID